MVFYKIWLCLLLLFVLVPEETIYAWRKRMHAEPIRLEHSSHPSDEDATVAVGTSGLLFPSELNSGILTVAGEQQIECPSENPKVDEDTEPPSISTPNMADENSNIFFGDYEIEMLSPNDVGKVELTYDTYYASQVKDAVPRKDAAESCIYMHIDYLQSHYAIDGNVPIGNVDQQECEFFTERNLLSDAEKYWFMKHCKSGIKKYKHTFHSIEDYLICKSRTYNLSDCGSALDQEQAEELYSC